MIGQSLCAWLVCEERARVAPEDLGGSLPLGESKCIVFGLMPRRIRFGIVQDPLGPEV